MAVERPRKSVEVREFPGLVNNLDPSNIPPGYALVQTNVTCIVEAELNTRSGYKSVSFEN